MTLRLRKTLKKSSKINADLILSVPRKSSNGNRLSIKTKKLLRPQDFIARIHPDQFIIYISHEEKQPLRSLERISKTLDAFSIYTGEGFKTLAITVTACLIDPQKCSNNKPFEKLIQFLYVKGSQSLSLSERLRLEWPVTNDQEDFSDEKLVFHQERVLE